MIGRRDSRRSLSAEYTRHLSVEETLAKGEGGRGSVRHVTVNIGHSTFIEFKTYTQALPHFDRLGYVSMMGYEVCCSVVVEKPLRNIEAPARAGWIRALFGEIARILNHLMAVLTRAMNVGALTPCLRGLRGAREAYEVLRVRPGGVAFDLPHSLLDDTFKRATQYSSHVDEIDKVVTGNRISEQRTINGGRPQHTYRLASPYDAYDQVITKIVVGILPIELV
ncbi:large subunit of nickel-iron hydrogenase [Schizophyllum commune H4-8]|uniref:NADH-quinone oxidoreductase subunit D domain-containing protein n=1 Tax=Schizophyllum commune (strain H4-8 / FGSC 9210) TaxID=578458 RepID=D8QF80_SCHCM|nr:large subunit of nickel-iron hydrogenase [Schizophyllum commune H4-8]KAI5887529.1 large subunit of nickel-iron hydrogenase [Schizophyllum commune H4-8]